MKPEERTQAAVPLPEANTDSQEISRGTRFWIAASLIVPVAVIGWASMLAPHDRPADSAILGASQSSPVVLSPNFAITGESTEDIQAAAREIDAKLMKRLAQRRASHAVAGPGLLQTRAKWQQKAKRVQREFGKFPNAKEGSVEWD